MGNSSSASREPPEQLVEVGAGTVAEPLVLQARQEDPTGGSHSMSDAQHALSAGSEGGELCAGTSKDGGKCCSWSVRREQGYLGWDRVWVQSVLQ